tara:strand:+ start:351 stop:716 length:366 start_codon:yes stop_codon:yes gene_type:complete
MSEPVRGQRAQGHPNSPDETIVGEGWVIPHVSKERCKGINLEVAIDAPPGLRLDNLRLCELDEDHFGIHMATTGTGATTWMRNWYDNDHKQDTYRLPITPAEKQPERWASFDAVKRHYTQS